MAMAAMKVTFVRWFSGVLSQMGEVSGSESVSLFEKTHVFAEKVSKLVASRVL